MSLRASRACVRLCFLRAIRAPTTQTHAAPFCSHTTKMSEQEFVQKIISEKPVVVFSKTYCPYCTMAKDTLAATGANFEVVELDQMSNGGQIQAALAAMTGRRTVPNVFLAGSTIGGGDDTVALQRSGRLTEMLASAGAL